MSSVFAINIKTYACGKTYIRLSSFLHLRFQIPAPAFSNSRTCVCLCPQQLPQQPVASLLHVVPGGLEVAGVPRVSHVAGRAGVVHQ